MANVWVLDMGSKWGYSRGVTAHPIPCWQTQLSISSLEVPMMDNMFCMGAI